MSTATAYLPTVDDLMPAARELAIQLDRVPSCNELKRELGIGYDKAKPLQDRLAEQAREYDEAVALAASLTQSDLAEPSPDDVAAEPQVTVVTEPVQTAGPKTNIWPIVVLALPAFVAIWSGWVGLGGLTGFGPVHLLPGIAPNFQVNTAITLPIGVETYAAYALRVWLGPGLPGPARPGGSRRSRRSAR